MIFWKTKILSIFLPNQNEPGEKIIYLINYFICETLSPTFATVKKIAGILRKSWWKIFSFVLLLYTVIGGFLLSVPRLPILNETIRNIYFHVAMWFVMMILFIVSVVYSIKYLRTFNYRYDVFARNYAATGTLLGVLGYITGAIWISVTWVTDQNQSLSSVMKEPKLIGAAIALLIYGAYFVLRGSFTDMDKRARVSAVYNIFAFAMLFPSIWIIPRLVGSLHPGSPGSDSGNPALKFDDLDGRMRIVFYPAIIGWTLLATWITTLRIRLELMRDNHLISITDRV